MGLSPVPPRDGAYRYMRWHNRLAKTADGTLPQGSTVILARQLEDPLFTARVQAAFESLAQMETQVRHVLNSEGVSTILYPYYLNFGRELWKLTGRISGQSAALEAATKIAKWVGRGLSPTVLARIRLQVFDLSGPVGP